MIKQFVEPLMITLLLETAAAVIAGLKTAKELISIALINVITNLSANLFLFLWKIYNPINTVYLIIMILELTVVISEWLFFRKIIENRNHPFLLSVYLNIVSFVGGIFLMKVI